MGNFKKVTLMYNPLNYKFNPLGSDLSNQLEYHGAVLEKKSLIAKDGEFRISKLGLVIDLIKALKMPEEITTKLTSAIIEGWRLDTQERDLYDRKEEMSHIMSSINSIRNAIAWSKRHHDPLAERRLDIAVLFAVPLMPSDLYPEQVSKVHALLAQLMDHLACLVEKEVVITASIPSKD